MAVKNYVERDTNPSPVTAAIAAILSILVIGATAIALVLFLVVHPRATQKRAPAEADAS
jgi:hypothetical protein